MSVGEVLLIIVSVAAGTAPLGWYAAGTRMKVRELDRELTHVWEAIGKRPTRAELQLRGVLPVPQTKAAPRAGGAAAFKDPSERREE